MADPWLLVMHAVWIEIFWIVVVTSECRGFANPWRVWLKGLKGMGQGTRVATHSIPLPL
jgi:hypothetical protein